MNDPHVLIGLPFTVTLVAAFAATSVALLFIHYYWRQCFQITSLPWEKKIHLAEADQRRIFRAPCDRPLELGDGLGRFARDSARIVNLSLGGLCFKSPKTLFQGQRIEAQIPASRDGLVRIVGKVVWLRRISDHSLYGLQIESVSDN